MSRNRNRRYQVKPGQQIITEKRDVAREMSILNRPASDFKDERVVQMFLDRIVAANDVEAAKLALALQAFLRGDAALLNNLDDPEVERTVNRQLAQAAAYDQAAARWEGDRDSFIEEMNRLYEQNHPTGENLDRVIAKGSAQFKDAREHAQARRAEQQLRLEYAIANGPKELIHVEPRYERHKQGEAYVEVALGEEIRILNKKFTLMPGDHLVPVPIAARYQEILRSRQETQKRKQAMLLDKNRSMVQMEQAQQAIDREFGTKRQAVPVREEY
jgi:hypothetical protein